MANAPAPRLGIAFSGGSVRGVAHLGVWEVLAQHGIRPYCVSGASAGSIIAVVVAAQVPLRVLYDHLPDLRWRRFVRPAPPWRLGWFTLEPLEKWLENLLGGPKTFEELPIPCALTAFDLEREEVVILREGPVARAVRASCAVPGIFTPVRWNGRLLADGGVMRNLPVGVLRGMGATFTVGVDLIPPARNRVPVRTPWQAMRVALYNMLRANQEIDPPDLWIRPDLRFVDFWRFPPPEVLIERGRQAALAVLPELLRALGRPPDGS